jgi:hypothetical protein
LKLSQPRPSVAPLNMAAAIEFGFNAQMNSVLLGISRPQCTTAPFCSSQVSVKFCHIGPQFGSGRRRDRQGLAAHREDGKRADCLQFADHLGDEMIQLAIVRGYKLFAGDPLLSYL